CHVISVHIDQAAGVATVRCSEPQAYQLAFSTRRTRIQAPSAGQNIEAAAPELIEIANLSKTLNRPLTAQYSISSTLNPQGCSPHNCRRAVAFWLMRLDTPTGPLP